MRPVALAIVLSFALVFAIACGGGNARSDAKASSSDPLVETRLELTLDDGAKPPALDGRAFAVPSKEGDLAIYVFDAKVSEPTCTDVNVGGWFEKARGDGVAQIRVASFPGRTGKYAITSITHVVGGRGKGRMALRSARARDAVLDLTRYDQVFEGKVGGFGPVSGIVCSGK